MEWMYLKLTIENGREGCSLQEFFRHKTRNYIYKKCHGHERLLWRFAAGIASDPVWVMNVVPARNPSTHDVIFDHGLIGVYHDWCEPFSTYPRTYELRSNSCYCD